MGKNIDESSPLHLIYNHLGSIKKDCVKNIETPNFVIFIQLRHIEGTFDVLAICPNIIMVDIFNFTCGTT